MPGADTLTVEKRFVALFVGESGSGKTGAACSFPGLINVDDFDGRIRGLLGCPWIDRKQIKYDYYPPKISNIQDKPNYQKITEKLDSFLSLARSGQLHFNTTILDSITSFNQAMVNDSMMLTHKSAGPGKEKTGKFIGTIPMADPGDYGFEANMSYNLIAYMKSVDISNVIVTAHTVDKYEKSDPDDAYSPMIVAGDKLSIRDKIGVNIQKDFDHIFKFSRSYDSGNRFWVEFKGPFARTSYPDMPKGKVEITGKHFYKDIFLPLLIKNNAVTPLHEVPLKEGEVKV